MKTLDFGGGFAMREKNIIQTATRAIIDVMFYLGIVCVVLTPFFSNTINRFYNYSSGRLILFITILFISGVCAVYILFNLKLMYKTLAGGNPFVNKNVVCLKRMAAACGIIALAYIVKCVFMFSVSTVIVVMVFVLGGLFCLTLKDIFKRAILYKEENDWTV